MIAMLRQTSLFLTATAVLVAALATGHARGQMPVAGQVVICVGLHVVTVSIDENGQPTTAHQTCPDAIAKLAAPPVDAPDLEHLIRLAGQRFDDPSAQHATIRPSLVLRARSPPTTV